MYCNRCAAEMKELKFSNSKPNSAITKFECECCKKVIIVAHKKDGNIILKERITE
jgi:hypothetical protein